MLTASLSRQAGGLFGAVCGLAQGLRGGDVRIRAVGLADAFTQMDAPAWDGIETTACPVRGPAAFGYSPALAGALYAAQPDLLHVHGLWMYPSAASLAWSRRTGRPMVVSPHGMLDPWAVQHSRCKKRLAGALYEHRHLRGAACVHALCEEEARGIRAYGLRNPIGVIPNGVRLPPEAGGVSPPWADAIPAGARVLLYLGRLHPKKNLEALLRGWAQATRIAGFEDWYLVVAGWDQGGYEQRLELLARERAVPRVWFAGPQFGAAKDACFRHADTFVLPSLSEGLPMTVLEAWAYRLPVLKTPACNLPAGFQAGAALPIGTDVDSIAQGLHTLLALGADRRREMGERGRALVEREFTWPQVAGQMVAVYRWVLGEGPRPACVVG